VEWPSHVNVMPRTMLMPRISFHVQCSVRNRAKILPPSILAGAR
jgi:hypothetical protein